MQHKDSYLKDRTVCKSCYNKNRREKGIITSHEQTKNENVTNNKNNMNNRIFTTYENHTYVVIGPKNVGKTYYMLKIIEKTGNKIPIHIITKSTNHYPNYKTFIDFKPIDKYEESVVIFDGMLGARNSSQKDELFTSEGHENLEVYYINQSFFGLSRQRIRNNSDRLILLKQT